MRSFCCHQIELVHPSLLQGKAIGIFLRTVGLATVERKVIGHLLDVIAQVRLVLESRRKILDRLSPKCISTICSNIGHVRAIRVIDD